MSENETRRRGRPNKDVICTSTISIRLNEKERQFLEECQRSSGAISLAEVVRRIIREKMNQISNG